MKSILTVVLLSMALLPAAAQNIGGKWYGKVTQTPGGYSQLYDFELDLKQQKVIWGESFAYIRNILRARLGLSGTIDGDTIRLKEEKQWIREEMLPPDWILCIKNINVAYRRAGSREYLQGVWNGVSKDDETDPCFPGLVILARTKEDLSYFLDSIHTDLPAATAGITVQLPDFKSNFNHTGINKVTEIEVNHTSLQLRVRDYLNVDDDTVSIYLNRQALARNVWLAKREKKINFRIDPGLPLNEVLIYAENLGKIPPNTSEMYIVDGDKTHKVMIEADKQKSAAIYLRYKP